MLSVACQMLAGVSSAASSLASAMADSASPSMGRVLTEASARLPAVEAAGEKYLCALVVGHDGHRDARGESGKALLDEGLGLFEPRLALLVLRGHRRRAVYQDDDAPDPVRRRRRDEARERKRGEGDHRRAQEEAEQALEPPQPRRLLVLAREGLEEEERADDDLPRLAAEEIEDDGDGEKRAPGEE